LTGYPDTVLDPTQRSPSMCEFKAHLYKNFINC
jgi:hypothetical protein